MKEERNERCTWKALLEMRNKLRPFIVHIVGKGTDISMSNNNWSPIGHLKKFISNRMLYDARLMEDSSVADMIEDGKWKWPDCFAGILNYLSLKLSMYLHYKRMLWIV